MRAVMVFGVFDKLHEGHRAFLSAARALGDRLIVAVAPDEVILALKDHAPAEPLAVRMRAIIDANLADEVLSGDTDLGTWEIVRRVKPDVIALGYDQKRQLEDLKRADLGGAGYVPEIRIMDPHEPEKFHTSIID